MGAINSALFHDLLSTWRQHDDLRRSSATVADLFESRRRLDEVRLEARRMIL